MSHKAGIAVGCKAPRHGCDFASKAQATAVISQARLGLPHHFREEGNDWQHTAGVQLLSSRAEVEPGRLQEAAAGILTGRSRPAEAEAALWLCLQCQSSVHLQNELQQPYFCWIHQLLSITFISGRKIHHLLWLMFKFCILLQPENL